MYLYLYLYTYIYIHACAPPWLLPDPPPIRSPVIQSHCSHGMYRVNPKTYCSAPLGFRVRFRVNPQG